jgi:hypothetical protein
MRFRGPALDRAVRHDVLVAMAFWWGRRRDARRADAPADEQRAIEAEYEATRDAYRRLLPFVGLARCPFTGVEAFHSLDHLGLDGPWWDHAAPVRPVEDLPSTWLAMPGALAIDADHVESFPFQAITGPGVPYVVRRLVEQPGVVAVLSAVPVGHHLGYAITYFAEGDPPDVRRANTWGASTYPVRRRDGSAAWAQVDEWPPDNDYDLGPWIRTGKLRWIAPGDDELRLRTEVTGCPFLGLEGPITYGIVQRGSVRYPPPPPPAAWGIRL